MPASEALEGVRVVDHAREREPAHLRPEWQSGQAVIGGGTRA